MKNKDWPMIISIVFLAGVFWFTAGFFGGAEGATVHISVSKAEIAVLQLKKNGIYEYQGLKYPFKVEIKDQMVRVTQAICPDKVCEQTGFIRYQGQSIVCLPNQVIITLQKADEQLHLDTVLN